MANPITTLDELGTLEMQFFTVLEAFVDLQEAYAAANPNATPVQNITTYTRDHLTGVITGAFTLNSETNTGPSGIITVVPTPFDY